MSVSTPIPAGVVSKIEGSVRVIRAGGKAAGVLKVGDTLNQGDAVVASAGATLQLTEANGQLWVTPAEGLPADLALSVAEESGVAGARATLLAQGQANLDEAVARLNDAGDDDAPAAGLAGGAAGALGEGLRVGRVQESVGYQEFEYETATLAARTELLAGGVINGDAPGNSVPVIDPSSPGFDPVAGNYSVTTEEDTAVSGQVVGSDADGDALTYALGTGPANGTVSVNANGSWTYTPASNFNGSDSFTVTVSDGKGGSTTATVNVGVTPANDVPVIDPSSPGFDPVAGNYSVTTEEDTAVSGQVVGSDADGDALCYALGTGPANGTVSVNANGSWTYTPAANFNGADSFTVTVSDGKGGTATATVNVGVSPVNDAPIARNDNLTAVEDTAVTYTAAQLLGNDADVDSATLTIASVTSGNGGSVVLNPNGTITFTPHANFNGVANFTYTVSDGSLTSAPATVNVQVAPVNDAPVVGTASATLLEANLSGSSTTQSGTISVSDIDGNALNIRLTQPTVNLTSGGTAVSWSLSSDGKTLIGSAGSAEVIRATIDDQGAYSVTLSKPIDHLTGQGQNTASFNIGVTASDGNLSTLSALTVNITDDTPQASATTHNLRVRTDSISVNDLDAGFTSDTYINGTSQVTRTNVDSHDTLIDRLRWGDAATSSGRSGYDLVDNVNLTSSTGASITEGTPFKLGDFTHSNYGIYSGSSTLDYTDVTIRMDVVINGVSTPINFTVRLNHTETTNSSDAIASRDIINLPTQTVSVQIAGQSYTVSLLGFQDRSGNIVNTIYTDENTNNNTFGIYAQVTSTQTPVQASGDLLSQAGADGAYLSELVIDGTRYAYNPSNGGSISVLSGTNRGTFSAAEQTLSVKTALGGTFLIDLDDGGYVYTAPTNVTASAVDRLDFTVRDTDGDTASSNVSINVAPPVTVTLSNNGVPYQGSNDPENITGSSGNDTIYGGGGADQISGGGGVDTIYGGQGNDVMSGGQGADVFAWALNDRGTPGSAFHDVITDFNTASRASGGDVLDLRDLLQGELHTGTNVGNLDSFLRFETVGSNTLLHISSTGAYGSGGYAATKDDQTITLQGVDLSNNNSLTNAQIIQNLLAAGKLITD